MSTTILNVGRWGLLLIGLAFGVFLILKPPAQHAGSTNSPQSKISNSFGQKHQNIEDVRVGMRVLARNPEVSSRERKLLEVEPEWQNWIRFSLELSREDGSIVQIDMMRPEQWWLNRLCVAASEPSVSSKTGTEAHGTESRSTESKLFVARPFFRHAIYSSSILSANGAKPAGLGVILDIPELGATGVAKITKRLPIKVTQDQSGCVVVSTFRHPTTMGVLNVTFEGDADSIGVTANHLFWSVRQKKYLPISKLELGEEVETWLGETKKIVSKLPRPGPTVVYNLEVFGEHVYFVGESGVLAHNSCPRNVLVVGEADTLEYSLNLARNNPNMRITTTGYRGLTRPTDLPSNLTVIEEGVDATRLSTHFSGGSFDDIVFNGPAGHPKWSATNSLIDGVLESAPDVLRSGGAVRFSSGFRLPSSRHLHRMLTGNTPVPGNYSVSSNKFFDDMFGASYVPRTNEGTPLTRPVRSFNWYIFQQ